ncbi:MAG TPA: glycosyltransferase [Pyrinomonadaceae bacterium]|nr:glycosyltransferase [Pyrinomonadaceae bacterium]
MKSVTMISAELDPFCVRGGTAYAIRRLADQLVELGIETRVLLPDWVDTSHASGLTPLLVPIPVKMRAEVRGAPQMIQCSEFCHAAMAAFDQIENSSRSDALIAHGDEGAMFIVLRNGDRSGGPSVFWLHSLYDPPLSDFSKEQRRLLPVESLLASAVMMADVVVTSLGVLKDAREFEWPNRMKELQNALTIASAEDRLLTVESIGCLPEAPIHAENRLGLGSKLGNLKNVPSRYVLFPGRPTVDKGFGIFGAIAERLRDDNIACVAVRRPEQEPKRKRPFRRLVHWLPWLNQEELTIAMRNAACTVLPSITEAFGLSAAESVSLGVATLYHEVGGHRALEGFPHAHRVPLTSSEREQLYGLWSDLIGTDPDSWSVWTKHEISLRPLIDKWVEAIRSIEPRRNAASAATGNVELTAETIDAERWGMKLVRSIANCLLP